MRLLLCPLLALALAAPAAAYDEEGLQEAPSSSDTFRNGGDEEEVQPLIQESDEDLADFVADYIRKDVQLKGAFLLWDPAAGRALRLELVALERKAPAEAGGARTVTANFRDKAGAKFTVLFSVQATPWGGLDISSIRLKPSGQPPAGAKEKK